MKLLNAVLQESADAILDKVIKNDGWRNLAMQHAEKLLRKSLVEDAPSNACFPLKAREEEYLTIRNMLHRINRQMERGLVAESVRKTLLKIFVGKVILKEDAAMRKFEQAYGVVPPGFLLVSPTSACNLYCKGCYANSRKADSRHLDYALFTRILKEKEILWGSHFTVLSGGEPTLWESRGKRILDVFREHPNQYFMMYTNGTNIDGNFARALAAAGNVTPAVSLEGFEEETDDRRGRGTFRKILAAFENLRTAGVPFGVSLTVTRHNLDRLLSDEFMDFCFEQQSAVYGWIFQYMPIGRGFTLDLMVTPEQRVRLFRRVQYLIREKELFLADFWNSGMVAHGCISAGRSGGYFYINWKGDVMPCAFFPYSKANVAEVYQNGGNLNTILFSPFFSDIRHWQNAYVFDSATGEAGNLIIPCPMRDHHQFAHDLVRKHAARPADQPAAEALQDADYHAGLADYDRRVKKLTSEIWDREYLRKTGAGCCPAEQDCGYPH